MKRLYVLIDSSLPKSYAACQAGHCVAEFMRQYSHWENEVLVYLKCDNLDIWLKKLSVYQGDYAKIQWTSFQEPDLNNAVTAIAVTGADKWFKHLPLF